MRLKFLLAIVLLFVFSTSYAQSNSPSTYVVGLSPFMDKAEKDKVWKSISELLVNKTVPGVRILIYDAYNIQKLADIPLPKDDKYKRRRSRAKFIAKKIGRVKEFFKTTSRGGDVDNAQLLFPLFVREISKDRPYFNNIISVILYGSGFYEDPREGSIYTKSGFPSDGFLKHEESVFDTSNRENSISGVQFHYINLDGDRWINDVHRKKIERFYSLYISLSGGSLVTFSNDISDSLNATRTDVLPSPFTLNESDMKPVMTSFGEISEGWWGSDVVFSTTPPSSSVDKIKIGITWDCQSCDVDLYVEPSNGKKILSYKQSRTNEGRHIKNFLTSPNAANRYEAVEFFTAKEPSKMHAWLNFYSGRSPQGINVEVRVLFGNNVYKGEFRLPTTSGNRGDNFTNKQNDPHWVTLDIKKLMRIP